ncbi:hypothetical protein IV203_010660 [Nitzschia inconspicua]|uniref:Uncharacterized protein n=1 Tax=Nitzschia inconspicua TaxID=303405 RepID=A0A9K3KY58_9STRA|nr:hypothetical protein IV203_010660 [Nitzschia inconspicua]
MKKLIIASRLHLGRASSPPSNDDIQKIFTNLGSMAISAEQEYMEASVLLAVDGTPKIEGYSYVETVKSLLVEDSKMQSKIEILPVTPWGKFVPALNSLVLYAKSKYDADLILFASAEVQASASTISTLCQHVLDSNDVIAAGAALKGHEYAGKGQTVALTGRTTPWNTLCVWDLGKLSLIGFAAISDLGPSAGVEECVAIALLQKLFPNSVAKLVQVSDISWQDSFQDDEERRKWHEEKMKSKEERPAQQLDRLNLSGMVLHC